MLREVTVVFHAYGLKRRQNRRHKSLNFYRRSFGWQEKEGVLRVETGCPPNDRQPLLDIRRLQYGFVAQQYNDVSCAKLGPLYLAFDLVYIRLELVIM